MNDLEGSVSQGKLSGMMRELLSEYDAILKVKTLQYATELNLGCELLRRDWESHETMAPLWEQYYNGSNKFAELYGTKTEEFQRYLDGKKDTVANFILHPLMLLVGKPKCPAVTHVMLDDDWFRFWQNVDVPGSDYIDELQRNSMNIDAASWGRENLTNYREFIRNIYRGFIRNILRQHVDRNNMKICFGNNDLRGRFQVLLDNVEATELESVTLGGKSLALIHEMKSNTIV